MYHISSLHFKITIPSHSPSIVHSACKYVKSLTISLMTKEIHMCIRIVSFYYTINFWNQCIWININKKQEREKKMVKIVSSHIVHNRIS